MFIEISKVDALTGLNNKRFSLIVFFRDTALMLQHKTFFFPAVFVYIREKNKWTRTCHTSRLLLVILPASCSPVNLNTCNIFFCKPKGFGFYEQGRYFDKYRLRRRDGIHCLAEEGELLLAGWLTLYNVFKTNKLGGWCPKPWNSNTCTHK